MIIRQFKQLMPDADVQQQHFAIPQTGTDAFNAIFDKARYAASETRRSWSGHLQTAQPREDRLTRYSSDQRRSFDDRYHDTQRFGYTERRETAVADRPERPERPEHPERSTSADTAAEPRADRDTTDNAAEKRADTRDSSRNEADQTQKNENLTDSSGQTEKTTPDESTPDADKTAGQSQTDPPLETTSQDFRQTIAAVVQASLQQQNESSPNNILQQQSVAAQAGEQPAQQVLRQTLNTSTTVTTANTANTANTPAALNPLQPEGKSSEQTAPQNLTDIFQPANGEKPAVNLDAQKTASDNQQNNRGNNPSGHQQPDLTAGKIKLPESFTTVDPDAEAVAAPLKHAARSAAPDNLNAQAALNTPTARTSKTPVQPDTANLKVNHDFTHPILDRNPVGKTVNLQSPATAEKAAADAVDVQQNIDKIVKAARTTISRGSSTIQMRLDPPELGTLRLELRQGPNGMTLQLQATSEKAQSLLQQHSHQLRSALESQGFQVNQIDIQLRLDLRNEAANQQNTPHDQSQSGSQHQNNPQNFQEQFQQDQSPQDFLQNSSWNDETDDPPPPDATPPVDTPAVDAAPPDNQWQELSFATLDTKA